jgi:ketosteroid isomerase-like protein
MTFSSWHPGWLGSTWTRGQRKGWGVTKEDAYESLVRRTYQDFESGDLDLLGVVMAREVVWHEPGRSSLAGDYKGPEEVLGFLGELKARTDGTFKIEVLDVLSEPERAVVFQRETAVRAEKTLDVVVAVEFEIHNGKITEVTVYQNDAYAFDEFWADDLGKEDNMDDIESELECSTREAGVGSLP